MADKSHLTLQPLGVLGEDKSVSPPGGPGTGFLPSFKAFLISAAFQAAYFCFCSSCPGKTEQQNCTKNKTITGNWEAITPKLLLQ